MTNVVYVAIDVDDTQWCFSALNEKGKDFKDLKCNPSHSALIKKLAVLGDKADMRICYEASYTGFTLYRALRKAGYQCDVIAPSLVPEKPGKKVKTNRLDSRKLVELYRAEMLTPVHVPEFEDEVDRNLLRSRKFLSQQLADLKKHITSYCRQIGLDYRKETGGVNYWTKPHLKWLKQRISNCKHDSLKINLKILFEQVMALMSSIETYNSEVEHLCEKPKYKRKAEALKAYRGIDSVFAMTLITEIGDPKRFAHPKALTSYAGFDLIEYSSGSKEKKFRISKDGNKHIRTAAVEICQYAMHRKQISKALLARRKSVDKDFIEIADRCLERLHKKGNRLIHRNKLRNKAVVACSRELLSFVWESLRAAA